VFSVIASSISETSMFQVFESTSTKTGFALQKAAALAVETKVEFGTITSSPDLIPAASNAT